MKSMTKRQKILVIISLVLLNIWLTLACHIVFDKNKELRYSLTISLSVIQIIIASQIDLNCSSNPKSIPKNQNSITNTSNENQEVIEETHTEVDEESGEVITLT
tara:strand:- start:47 stop:358 length:312 start_codon:yes stop_codon:yes gene_type:complete